MLEIRNNFCQNIRHVVLDEADLLLSFGYEQEMKFAFTLDLFMKSSDLFEANCRQIINAF